MAGGHYAGRHERLECALLGPLVSRQWRELCFSRGCAGGRPTEVALQTSSSKLRQVHAGAAAHWLVVYLIYLFLGFRGRLRGRLGVGVSGGVRVGVG